MSPVSGLEEALAKRERAYAEAIEQLHEAVFLVSILRRLVRGLSVAEIHAAFGAPGDFGYETPIGAALSDLYQRAAREARGEPAEGAQ